jgi:hypothetical protein
MPMHTCWGEDQRLPVGTSRSSELQTEVMNHRVEVSVVVQQSVSALDAECADDHIDCLADRDVPLSEHAVVSGSFDCRRRIQHRHNSELSKVPLNQLGMRFVARAL